MTKPNCQCTSVEMQMTCPVIQQATPQVFVPGQGFIFQTLRFKGHDEKGPWWITVNNAPDEDEDIVTISHACTTHMEDIVQCAMDFLSQSADRMDWAYYLKVLGDKQRALAEA